MLRLYGDSLQTLIRDSDTLIVACLDPRSEPHMGRHNPASDHLHNGDELSAQFSQRGELNKVLPTKRDKGEMAQFQPGRDMIMGRRTISNSLGPVLLPPRRGIYSIGIRLEEPMEVNIRGNLHRLESGTYVYTGSALGASSNLHTRIGRHLSGRKKRHWHIDQITSFKHASISFVVFSETEQKMECAVNKSIAASAQAEAPVPGFGSSDCRSGCRSHLLFLGQKSSFPKIVRAHRLAKLNPKALEVKGKESTERREKNQTREQTPMSRPRSDRAVHDCSEGE